MNLKIDKMKSIYMSKGKKCPKCGNWTMHQQNDGYWRCSSCGAVTFD